MSNNQTESKTTSVLVGFLPEEYAGVEVLRALGAVTYYRYDRAWLEEHIQEFDIIVPHLFIRIDRPILERARRLKTIATPSTGTDHLDLPAMRDCGIRLVSLNDDRSFIDTISSTAELSWLLVLACARRLTELLARVRDEGSWVNTDIRGAELFGKTIGIIGYGRLGRKVSRYAEAFGMRVLATDTDPSAFSSKQDWVQPVSLERVLQESDVISVHVKLNNTSTGLIGADEARRMKRGVILVNTARGEVLDSVALLDALESGTIGALGLDVLNNEYQSTRLPDDPLVRAAQIDPRIIITPHAGGSTHDAHSKVFRKIADLLSGVS